MDLKKLAVGIAGDVVEDLIEDATGLDIDLTQDEQPEPEPKAERQNSITNRRRLIKITPELMGSDPDIALERFDFHFGDLFATEKDAVAFAKQAFKFSQAKREETTASKVANIKASLSPQERQRLLEELQAG